MPGQRKLLPPAALDDMYQSLNDAFRAAGLAPLRFTPPPDVTTPAAAPQRAPNPATAPQTTPPQPTLQNKPITSAPCPKKSQNVRSPATHPAPTRQSAPSHANAPHPAQACKTNPPPPAPSSILHPQSPPRRLRPLTPNQLRAARLLVAGQSTNAIAATLHIDRHTFADWKRLPLFQQEIRCLVNQADPTTPTQTQGSRGGNPPTPATGLKEPPPIVTIPRHSSHNLQL
jgi:hypothetical protein